MKIRWLGHSAFVLTSSSGTKVLTDPYKSGSYDGAVSYKPITESVQVITSSHSHEDHYCLDGLPVGFECITTPGAHEASGISIEGVKTYHDTSEGKDRGGNIIYIIEIDSIRVCHLGDLGHELSDEDIAAIGRVDVLLTPVGGFFTIGPEEALGIMRALSPAITIPMHFKTESLGFPIRPVDDFLLLAGESERPGATEIEIKKDEMGSGRVVVLDHEL